MGLVDGALPALREQALRWRYEPRGGVQLRTMTIYGKCARCRQKFKYGDIVVPTHKVMKVSRQDVDWSRVEEVPEYRHAGCVG